MATFLSELLVSALMLIGAGFVFVGSYGLAKLPDLMTRLHAPTKASTLGVGSILLASLCYFGLIEGSFSLHELLISLFIFITAPVSALMVAKAYIFRTRGDTAQPLPAIGRPSGWATLAAPDPDASTPMPPEVDPTRVQ
jgi:multicomponent K+:H+ antiporter subunit G